MEFSDWNNNILSDVSDGGPNSLYSLICDYQKATKDYGWMPVNDFVKSWTAIKWKDFKNLQKDDIVYDYSGSKWICIDSSYLDDDEIHLYVECVRINKDSSFNTSIGYTETFSIGDLYFAPNYTRLAEYRHKNLEREERACPILITKTKHPQN